MEDDLDANYELMSDIDASQTAQFNDGRGLDPVGNNNQFTGSFDGNSHTITRLTIDRPDERAVGLFGQNKGTISNLSVTKLTVTGANQVGGLVGDNSAGGAIQNTTVSGDVTGEVFVGGLAGVNEGGGSIQSVTASVSVSGRQDVGGLVGNSDGSITDAKASGSVSGGSSVGGLVGANKADSTDRGNIQNAIAAGNVSGADQVGGLVGENDETATIKQSYFDTEATGQNTSAGSAAGLTTAQMQGAAVRTNMDGLDFENTWTTTDGYPALRALSETDTGDNEGGETVTIVEYNPQNGTSTRRTITRSDGAFDSAEPSLPNSSSSVTAPSASTANYSKQRINATDQYPWSAIGRLKIYADGGTKGCTGTLVDDNHVVTAAHCVYDASDNSWRGDPTRTVQLTFAPGRDSNSRELGIAAVTRIQTYETYLETGNDTRDLAVLTLNKQIGGQAGTFGYSRATADSSRYTKPSHLTGYPSADASYVSTADEQWDLIGNGGGTDFLFGTDCAGTDRCHNLDTEELLIEQTREGQSGGPIWQVDETGQPEVVSVIQGTSRAYTAGVRISDDTYSDIGMMIQRGNNVSSPERPQPPASSSLTAQNAVAVHNGSAYLISSGEILKIDLATRSVVSRFQAPNGTNRGLAYGAGSLWYADAATDPYNGQILELNPDTGEVRSTINTGYDPYGLAFGDGSLWAGEVTGVPNNVYRFSPDGQQLSSFDIGGPAGSTGPNGLAYANGSVWVGTGSDLFELGPDGAVVQSISEHDAGYKGLAGTATTLYGPDKDGELSIIRTFDNSSGPSERTNPPAPPGPTGISTGDPHIITFDGLAYDFQAAGEFILIEESNSVEIQVRQVPVSGRDRDVTVNTAVATLVDGTRVMIDARSSRETDLIVNGTPVEITAGDPVAVGDGMIFYDDSSGRYTVVYPGDDGEITDGDTQLIANIVNNRLDIRVHTGPSNHSSFRGLLGDIDNDTSDDIALANGSVLARPPAFDSLYGPFRTSWRVNDSTSLFYYNEDNGPDTYYQSDVPGETITIDDFPQDDIETARNRARNAGVKTGSANFRNAVLDYLLTGESSYFESAKRAPETPADNLIVSSPRDENNEDDGADDFGVDGFEDRDLAEYNDVEAATTTTETSYRGDSAAVITDRNEEMFRQDGHYTGNRIQRDLADGQPNRLAGAVRIGSGPYNDLRMYWRNETGKAVVGVNLDTYRNNFYYNGTAVADISPGTWYNVEFVGLNWKDNTVSEIRVDGRVVASDVTFLNDADRVYNLTMSVNDAGTGSRAYFDEITVSEVGPGGEETAPSLSQTVRQAGSPGGQAQVQYTLSNVSGQSRVELDLAAVPQDLTVNESASTTSGTFESNGRKLVFSSPSGGLTPTIAFDIAESADSSTTFTVTADLRDETSAATDSVDTEIGATAALGPGDLTGNGQAATDPDGDGTFEDVNGDGDADTTDVTALFNVVITQNFDSQTEQQLDINGDGNVDTSDVTKLFVSVI